MHKFYKSLSGLVIVLVSAVVLSACSSATPTVQSVPHVVKEVEDLSMAKIIRTNYRVVFSEEVTHEELKAVAEQLINQAKKDKPFNAVSVMFYDYPEYAEDIYTLGKIEYAPEGEWSKANSVSAGSYSNFQYKYDLKTKDWSKRLSQEEATIWKTWYDASRTANANADALTDDEAIKAQVAKSLNITPEKLEEVILKKVSWSL